MIYQRNNQESSMLSCLKGSKNSQDKKWFKNFKKKESQLHLFLSLRLLPLCLGSAKYSLVCLLFSSLNFINLSHVYSISKGAHAIMKNGGMLGRNGTLMLVTAAKAFSVPVVVLSSSVKLTPYFPFE